MTSKEAIQKIKEFKVVISNRSDDYESFNPMPLYYDKELKIIEKDLEVLEILKKLINGLESTFNREGISSDTTILGTIIKDYFIDNDETELVKEWLEK